jgi:hypothetical protein
MTARELRASFSHRVATRRDSVNRPTVDQRPPREFVALGQAVGTSVGDMINGCLTPSRYRSGSNEKVLVVLGLGTDEELVGQPDDGHVRARRRVAALEELPELGTRLGLALVEIDLDAVERGVPVAVRFAQREVGGTGHDGDPHAVASHVTVRNPCYGAIDQGKPDRYRVFTRPRTGGTTYRLASP